MTAILHLWLWQRVKAAASHLWIAVNITSRWRMMWNIKRLFRSPFMEKSNFLAHCAITAPSLTHRTTLISLPSTQTMLFEFQKIVVNLTHLAPPLAHVCITVCMCVCVWEQERVEGSTSSSVCQRSQSPGSLIPLPGGLENFLSSFPVLSPRWARRATPGKFMLMSAMKTPPSLDRVSQYLSNSGLSILSLSLSFSIHLFSSSAVNISILTDSSEKKNQTTHQQQKNVNARSARAFALPVSCCLCGDCGIAALEWSPSGPARFGLIC